MQIQLPNHRTPKCNEFPPEKFVRNVFKAKCNSTPNCHREIRLHAGEKYEVIGFANCNRVYVRCIRDNVEGFTYFQNLESREDIRNMILGKLSRSDADDLLINISKDDNSTVKTNYLLRSHGGKGTGYTLSVLGRDNRVKHYPVYNSDGKLYISRKKTFKDLFDLISNYTENCDGLCVRLGDYDDLAPNIKTATETKGEKEVDASMDAYEIPRDQIKLGKIVGKGSFGIVYQGFWRESSIPLAVKVLTEDLTSTTEDFLDEAAKMKMLNHANLVQLYCVCTKESPIYLIMEYVAKGALSSFMKTDEAKALPIRMLINFCVQIADGMVYLGQQKMLHRDLAARNVLIDADYSVKIADFGFARQLHEGSTAHVTKSDIVQVRWGAPETWHTRKFTVQTEVWSYGVVLWEIFSYGTLPFAQFDALHAQEIMSLINRGDRLKKPEKCPDLIYYYMRQCWEQLPESRPTFRFLKDELERLMD